MDIENLLELSGALLRGHFLLTSGRHSGVYLEKFRILEQPEVLSKLCEELIRELATRNSKLETHLDFVAGPTTGGIIIAFEVGRQMGLPTIYVETEDGKKTLRRGRTILKGAKVLVVDDVLTTGTSLIETRKAIEEAGGEVVAYAVLIDRSPKAVDLGLPTFASFKADAETYPSYAPDEIPDWLAAIPAVKPGTRK
ncbi:MAG: orotate phosphoribosyltransferase [Chlorobia bacterium]|nr:orotate phosphoribosyltransferase [Fimbriimonadaceae bacterium]